MDLLKIALDIGLGLAAFRLAWSVDRTQKEMLKVQTQQAQILMELVARVTSLEGKIDE
jgi:hypothetical protein